MNHLPFMKVPLGGGGSSGGSSREDGYYYVVQASSTPPAPTDPSWTATTKLDDVGVDDHTTYEEATSVTPPTDWVYGMKYVGAGQTWASYTASIGYTEAGELLVAYWSGTEWLPWDAPNITPGLGVFAWTDLNRNPTDQTGVAVLIGVRDTLGFGTSVNYIARIGDFRPA